MSQLSQPFACAEIRTPRLDLVAVTPESIACQLGFPADMYTELGEILRAEVPAEWPHENWEQHVLEYLLKLFEESPESAGWCRYLLLRDDAGRRLIGTFGCALPSVESGEAELGYGLLPAFQRQGFAAEAVQAMMPRLAAERPVRAFVAQTFPHLRGSIRVLEKCGFEKVGPGSEQGAVLYRSSVS